ncbi:Gfo/Idh/MocA family oxidoreductase [Pendulispora rubella]|uniref:Gfo/Idh/MocA family oxidoreductase n=1 Tax=Pendulispora rubella TaxID=2741070 RepID=A0ABZ2L070_9BACT|nr:SrbI [Sorangiineae bacterium]
MKRRVLVAGTAFGRIYLAAVASAPESFELAGVLARGSDYSRDVARQHGVPLYTSVEQVPGDVDIGCVVVRSAATGGDGAELAQALLARGIHVLHEHPVHVREITACLQAAKRGGAAYAVNTLYPNVRPIRRFLAAAARLRPHQRVAFVDAACNSQVAYPLLDVIGRAVGGLRPWSFGGCAPDACGSPFRILHATLGGAPVTLRVQNQVHPEDPDNHSHFMHRLEIGFEAGVLTLADTHGLVLWNPRLHAPRDATGRLQMGGPGTERLAVPSTSIIGGAEAGSYHDVFARTWPEAVVAALRDLCDDIADPARRARAGQWALAVSSAWRDLTARIGMPELIRPGTPQPFPLEDLHDHVL